MWEDDFDDEDYENEEDYCLCPSCGSNVAVIENNFQFGEVAHCKHDCGYKWYMLIEPDPCTFNDVHPYKKKLKANYDEGLLPTILGHDSKIVAFEGNIEDIYHEDPERHDRILKYSDLNDTLITGHMHYEENNIPHNLPKKRQRFFETHANGIAKEQNIYHLSTLERFLAGNESLDNFIYVMGMVCHMEIRYNELSIKETEEFNSNIDKGYKELEITPKVIAILYNQYQKHSLAEIVNPEHIEDYVKRISEYLFKEYGISFLYLKSTEDKNDGCRPLETWQKEILDDNSIDLTLEELTLRRLEELKESDIDNGTNQDAHIADFKERIAKQARTKLDEIVNFVEVNPKSDLEIDKYFASEQNKNKVLKTILEEDESGILNPLETETNIDLKMKPQSKEIKKVKVKSVERAILNDKPLFYSLDTTYGKTIEELFGLIKEDGQIAFASMKPYIISLKEYMDNIKSNIDTPAMIDFDNKIVFLNISHKAIIYTLNDLILEQEILNGKITIEDKKELETVDFDEAESYFHKQTNTIQLFTSLIDRSAAKVLSCRKTNNEVLAFENLLKENEIEFKTIQLLESTVFTTLNGKGKVTGEIYFPKEDEENIEPGKILVVPTASEEYFLPAISQMGSVGCIITERGSKTSHLIINSKEFNFNIILVKDATKLFIQGETITLDLDMEEII